jgi:hypothetical protein
VAVQRDFYKLNLLTDEDIKFIREIFIEPLPEVSRGVSENFLLMFGLWPRQRAALTEAQIEANPELVALIDEQIFNAEEDFHSGVESRAAPLVEAARKGNLSFYEDRDSAITFCHFMCLQHFRTKAIRERTIQRFSSRLNIDISRTWNIISHILAVTAGASLFRERKARPLFLLQNETSIPFITSDQPTVNLQGGSLNDAAPEHLSFYYPIAPTLALLWDEPGQDTGFRNRKLTDDDVKILNAQEIRTSNLQVFANTSAALDF